MGDEGDMVGAFVKNDGGGTSAATPAVETCYNGKPLKVVIGPVACRA